MTTPRHPHSAPKSKMAQRVPSELTLDETKGITARNDRHPEDSSLVGRWSVSLSRDHVDAVWEKIVEAIQKRDLWRAAITRSKNSFILEIFATQKDKDDFHEIAQHLWHLRIILKKCAIHFKDTNLAYQLDDVVVFSAEKVIALAKKDLQKFYKSFRSSDNLSDNLVKFLNDTNPNQLLIPQLAPELGMLDEYTSPLEIVVENTSQVFITAIFHNTPIDIREKHQNSWMHVLELFFQKMHPIFHDPAALNGINMYLCPAEVIRNIQIYLSNIM